MSLTEHLIAARKRAALSQGEVAEALGVSRQAVSRWENGLALPSTDNLARLSRLSLRSHSRFPASNSSHNTATLTYTVDYSCAQYTLCTAGYYHGSTITTIKRRTQYI